MINAQKAVGKAGEAEEAASPEASEEAGAPAEAAEERDDAPPPEANGGAPRCSGNRTEEGASRLQA